jgi:hypothetical protein
MTPRDVDALSYDEFVAFWEFADRHRRAEAREARKARARR